MSKEKWQAGAAPLGLYFSFLAKLFAGAMGQKLSDIDLDKYFRVLVVVEQSKETLTQQNLSDYFKTSKVSMVRIIDHLTKKKYLRRKTNAKDRREHFLILTEKSKRELPLIKHALHELEASALQGFSEDQKKQFFQFLEQIYINMSELPSQDIFVNYDKVETKPLLRKKISVVDTAEG
jgi:DNA-binding MarR family transcriptional regulator